MFYWISVNEIEIKGNKDREANEMDPLEGEEKYESKEETKESEFSSNKCYFIAIMNYNALYST